MFERSSALLRKRSVRPGSNGVVGQALLPVRFVCAVLAVAIRRTSVWV